MPAVWTVLAAEAEVAEGKAVVREVGDLKIALCRAEGKIYAIEDRCSHDDGPLGEGDLEGCIIMCPRHGAKFDIRTGEVVRMPAAFPCRTFPVKVEGGKVLVETGS